MSTQRDDLANELEVGACELEFPLTKSQIDRMLEYMELLSQWSKHYNLSAIRGPREILYKHLLDSLSLAPTLAKTDKSRLIDVGSGAGLPGIPLAICFPERHFTLLDSAGKKTRFLFQVRQSLALANVDIQNMRAERYCPEEPYEVVLSRAFSLLNNMIKVSKHLLLSDGEFWAMKGVFPQDELSDLEKHYKVKACFKLQIPGDIGKRCLLIIQSQQVKF